MPMMPPPMITSVLGISGKLTASFADTMVLPSNGMLGI
jgi:hypothetical protein